MIKEAFRVPYSSLVTDIKYALSSVLDLYFKDVKHVVIAGTPLSFPDCNIYYDISVLNNTDNKAAIFAKPVIAITGSRNLGGKSGVQYLGKCRCLGMRTETDRAIMIRTVYIKTLNKYPLLFPGIYEGDDDVQMNCKEMADRIWSLLYTVFTTQVTKFATVGLYSVNLDMVPMEESNEQETVLAGQLRFSIDVVRTLE